MPLFILLIGIALVAAGINNKIPELTTLVKSDFQRDGNTPPFQLWIIAIFVVGAAGYYLAFRKFSNAFLFLIVIGLFLSNKGFFEKFTSAIEGK